MKPSEKCKAAGLKSLAELAELTGRTTRTLQTWSEDDPVFFETVLIGAIVRKNQATSKTEIEHSLRAIRANQ